MGGGAGERFAQRLLGKGRGALPGQLHTRKRGVAIKRGCLLHVVFVWSIPALLLLSVAGLLVKKVRSTGGAFWALTKRPWGVSLFLNLETNCHAFLYSFKITVSRKIFSSELKIFSEYNASNLKRKRVA